MCILRGFLKTRIFVFSIVRRRHLHEMGRIAGFDCGNDAPWDLRRNLDAELSLVPRRLETRTKRGFPHSHSDYGDGTRLSGKTNPAKIAGPVGFLNRTEKTSTALFKKSETYKFIGVAIMPRLWLGPLAIVGELSAPVVEST